LAVAGGVFALWVGVLLAVALLPLPEPLLLELDCEPAVQPAAIMPAATMTPYLVRRLMPFVLTADGPAVLWVLTGRGAGGCARSRRLPHAPGPGPHAEQPPRLSDV
jgi:hypothetical protein